MEYHISQGSKKETERKNAEREKQIEIPINTVSMSSQLRLRESGSNNGRRTGVSERETEREGEREEVVTPVDYLSKTHNPRWLYMRLLGDSRQCIVGCILPLVSSVTVRHSVFMS